MGSILGHEGIYLAFYERRWKRTVRYQYGELLPYCLIKIKPEQYIRKIYTYFMLS